MLLFLDLETVSNPNLPPALIDDLMDVQPDSRLKDPEKIREDIEKKRLQFLSRMGLSPLTGKICCASIKCISEDDGSTVFERTIFNKDEKALLISLMEGLEILSPNYVLDRVVTFNGKEFDIPFLITRLAVNKIYSRRVNLIGSGSKYNQDSHFDLYAHLSHFGTFPKGRLPQWAAAFGIITTIPEDDGSKVQEWYDNEEYDKICAHCEEDRKLTEALFFAITGEVLKPKVSE